MDKDLCQKSAEHIETRRKCTLWVMRMALGLLSGDDRDDFDIAVAGDNSEEIAYAVSLISKHYGLNASNLRVSPKIAEKLDQVGMLRLLVKKANMQIRLVTLEANWYRQDCGSLIGYYGKEKKLAAFISKKPGYYMLFSKEYPDGMMITDDVAAEMDGHAFACYPGLPLRKLASLDIVRLILKGIWMRDIGVLAACCFIAGAMALVMPVIMETVFNDIVPTFDYYALAAVTQVLIVSSFTTFIISALRSVAMVRISGHSDMIVDAAIISRILNLPAKFFRRYQSGELVKQIMGLQEIKKAFIGPNINAIFGTVFSFVSIFLMFYYSVKLTILCLMLWGAYVAVMACIYRKYVAYKSRKVEHENKLSGLVMQIFSGLAKFRIHGCEEYAYFLWSKNFSEVWKWNLKLRWQRNYANIFTSVQPVFLSLCVYMILVNDIKGALEAGKNVNQEVISYASFLAFQTAMTGFNTSVNQLVPAVAEISSLLPYWKNLSTILQEKPEISVEKRPADLLTGAVDISHVSFGYDDDRLVLKDVSLKIDAGDSVAIVGSSGSGKSSLIRLLLGFEKPRQGAIYYDGQDFSDISVDSVRSQMGVVLQNGQLMTGDILSNIVGNTALGMEAAWEAAEAAGIADDIREMPMGMQTVISEGGGNISGGQRQRLLIARALASKPAIIIFDEATSALDNRSQRVVTESLDRLKITRIVVAHRLSTIRSCNKIVVLDQGRIVESGTYEELLNHGGIFTEMARRQML